MEMVWKAEQRKGDKTPKKQKVQVTLEDDSKGEKEREREEEQEALSVHL